MSPVADDVRVVFEWFNSVVGLGSVLVNPFFGVVPQNSFSITMKTLLSRLSLYVLLILFTGHLEGAVTHWEFLKGIGGAQTADNEAPSVTSWDIEIFLETSAAGDATAVSISGGGIEGSLAFTFDENEWIFEQEFASEAAMDALFPNNASYTILLSGGTLGTVTQTVSLGPKAYPDLLYLTGTGFSALKNFDPTTSFDFDFATSINTGDLISIEIEGADDSPFEALVPASQTTINLPANTLAAGKTYQAYGDHLNRVIQSGAGGFGVDGNVIQTAFIGFDIVTTSVNSIIGAWSFGDALSDGSGVVMFMKDLTYYHIEDVEAEDPEPDGFESGTYTWNEQTGAFTASPRLDTNGEVGLSHPVGSVTVTVSGDSLTYADGEGNSMLTRIESDGHPLVGAWQYGEGRPFDSRALVFLPNGVYFEAQDFGVETGMEKGSYDWNEVNGSFEVEVRVDTNETLAFSNELNGFEISVQGDEMLIFDGDQEWRLYLVNPTTVGYPVPQVTHWKFVKGRDHFQNKNNAAPPIAAWSVYVVVETKMNQDALEMEIRGGGIPGAYALVQNSARGWTFEKDYHSEAAMDEEFPAGAEFTIELSGGYLGTMSQTFTLMADQYPNTPYLTGTSFSAAQSFDSFDDLPLDWNFPGGLTESNGQTLLEVFRFYDDESVFRKSMMGASTQGTVPAGTVWPGHTFYGYLEYTHARIIDGSGGFEIDGTESRNAAVDFTLGAFNSPLAGAWSYGDSSGDDSGVLVFLNNGTFFQIEDVNESSPDSDGFERGEYIWDRDSGAFEFEVHVDTNGTAGLSDSGILQSVVVSGNSLTLTDDGESEVLSKVTSETDGLVGGWQWGDGGEEYGGVYVFLDTGYYFGLVYDDPVGLSLDAGIERGTYAFYEEDLVPVFETNAILDTNGERGLSHVDGEWAADLFNDTFSFGDNRGGESLTDVELADVRSRMSLFDTNLESAFRVAAGKSGGTLLRIDLQRILTMDASGRGITEVEGFSEAYNLRELDLSNNAIEDIWQIGDLHELRVLDLSSNQISDISYLSSLTKLVELDLSSNLLSDPGLASDGPSDRIQTLSEIKTLESTGALGVLDGIDTLEILEFANNGIRDLNVLATLPSLRKIDLSGNEVSDLSPLGQLPLLEKVALFGNPVDLTEGSSQLELLNTIIANTGVNVLLEAPDPLGNFLNWEWDESNGRYRLIWTESGALQTSSDLETWVNLEDAQSPYPVENSSENPVFWKLNLSF